MNDIITAILADPNVGAEFRSALAASQAGQRMYALLREGLTGIKADGQFTDDTWLSRVRDLLEDEIDTDNEGEAE